MFPISVATSLQAVTSCPSYYCAAEAGRVTRELNQASESISQFEKLTNSDSGIAVSVASLS